MGTERAKKVEWMNYKESKKTLMQMYSRIASQENTELENVMS